MSPNLRLHLTRLSCAVARVAGPAARSVGEVHRQGRCAGEAQAVMAQRAKGYTDKRIDHPMMVRLIPNRSKGLAARRVEMGKRPGKRTITFCEEARQSN